MRQLSIFIFATLFSLTAVAQDPTETHVNEASGLGYVVDHEGNPYRTAKFGTAGWWMTQNLATKSLPSDPSTPIPFHTVNDAVNPQIAYPQPNGALKTDVKDIPNYERSWGMLYNWPAATNKKVSSANEEGTNHAKVQGICPAGWHLPSDVELTELETVMAANASYYSNGQTANGAATGTSGVMGNVLKSPLVVPGAAIPTQKGQSLSSFHGGFNLLLAGYAYNGFTHSYGSHCYLWSSSSGNGSRAWNRYVGSSSAVVDRYTNDRYYLFSVRCKKD